MRILKTLAAVGLALPLAASAASITNSPHDLAFSNTTPGAIKATDAAETNTCKFCHTPHGANGMLALWNHEATANTVFSWGGGVTETTAGTDLPLATAGFRGPTLRCLSCHDGSTALGDTIAPAGVIATSSANMPNNNNRIGTGGNLANNHPVGIPYVGQTVGGRAGLVAGVFPGNGYVAAASVTGAKLYTAGAANDLSVECSSCHEPHDNQFGNFLRASNTGGALCKACHSK
jgi:predicted CXXCH cytochrome family protein